MLEKNYTIIKDPPSAVPMHEYIGAAVKQYHEMLENPALDEKAYQLFFEENPAFIPGAFEVIGCSGHDAYLGALISQPRIGGDLIRIPDFMWLASDSLSFCPVLIEIEKPSKVQFKNNNVPYAKFNQALDQITEWKALLEDPDNRERFYETFSIPDKLRGRVFAPQYLLIYGRRSEYEDDSFKRNKRYHMQSSDTVIMSFDRLNPIQDAYNVVSAQVSGGKYYVKHIPPTYVYEPWRAEYLPLLCGFKERIKDIKMISEERRRFLYDRFDYWNEIGKRGVRGIMEPTDRE